MNIGILGTGVVGSTLGTKLIAEGCGVKMGSRTANNLKGVEWAESAGPNASAGTFADAAEFGEVIFNCTSGAHSIEALKAAGIGNLQGKIVVDVSNPLDFSNGFPPTLSVCNTDSLGEQIQRAFPEARVVKTFNTMNAFVMVNPDSIPEPHTVFVCGNDPEAKAQVTDMLKNQFGWKPSNIMDLGDITSARATEMLLPMWVRLYAGLQNPNVAFHIAVGPKAG